MSAVCYELVSIKIRQAVKNYVTEVSQIATLQHKKISNIKICIRILLFSYAHFLLFKSVCWETEKGRRNFKVSFFSRKTVKF